MRVRRRALAVQAPPRAQVHGLAWRRANSGAAHAGARARALAGELALAWQSALGPVSPGCGPQVLGGGAWRQALAGKGRPALGFRHSCEPSGALERAGCRAQACQTWGLASCMAW